MSVHSPTSVVIRTDASTQIGTGHVMRCITLATALRNYGIECCFVCRKHPGHLLDRIQGAGFKVTSLPGTGTPEEVKQPDSDLAHCHWLGTDWKTDAEQTITVLEDHQPDWLIVDHYALDVKWELELRPYCNKIMVIDDLANRHHDCNLLLSQNLVRGGGHFQSVVPPHCLILSGPETLLFRQEFVQTRLLPRVQQTPFQRLLITMGGNATESCILMLLKKLSNCLQSNLVQLTIVLGFVASQRSEICELASLLSCYTDVLQGVSNIARLMITHDVAISAGGFTSYELVFLGVPTIVIPVSSVQLEVARFLQEHAHVEVLDHECGNDEFLKAWNNLEKDVKVHSTWTTNLFGSLNPCAADLVWMAMSKMS